MTRKSIVIGILAGLLIGTLFVYRNTLLAARASQTEAPGISQTEAPRVLFLQEDTPELSMTEIVETMLNSHKNWQTLRGELVAWGYGPLSDPNGPEVQKATISLVIDQPYNLYADSYNDLFDVRLGMVIDGTRVCEVDFQREVYTCRPFTPSQFAYDLSLLPESLAAVQEQKTEEGIGIVIPHPMEMIAGPAIGEMAYPTSLAQSGGIYVQATKDTYLGRSVWVLDWQKENDDGHLVSKQKLWVDVQTGVILKTRRFAGPEFVRIGEEIAFTEIAFDQKVDTAVFAFEAAPHLREVTPYEYHGVPEDVGKRD